MDINWIVNRVKNVLLTPKNEWPVIAEEAETVSGLYMRYILIMSAIPALAQLIQLSLLGSSFMGVTVRVGFGDALVHSIVGYGVSLLMIFIMSLVVNALAATFNGEKNSIQALKAITYSWTAVWVGTVLGIIPGIGFLFSIAGLVYAIYQLYLGLQFTMKAPQDKAVGYTAVTVIIGIVLALIVGVVVGTITGAGRMAAGLTGGGSEVTVDPDSPLGKMEQWGKAMEKAGKEMEQAEASGDKDAQAAAAAKMLGTVLSGGEGQVESVPTDTLKALVPDTLQGLARSSLSAERNAAMGVQVSTTQAEYSAEDGRSLRLEITDAGSMSGMLAMAGWANMESEREDEYGYEKTYKADGRMVHERWDKQNNSGEYALVVAGRFTVKVEGNMTDMDSIKAAVNEIDLGQLEALKDAGKTGN